jgi:hypothetical protein
MTKQVRIENADNSPYKIKVFIERKDTNGEWIRDSSVHNLDYPTNMLSDFIHDGKRLVIEETE